jgi:hypothetical protein
MKFYAKTYTDGDEYLVACCDEDICGKTFEEGELILEVAESFYCDKILGRRDVCSLLQEATILNIVGKRIVKLAISEGIILKQSVMRVKGVPHAQMVKM